MEHLNFINNKFISILLSIKSINDGKYFMNPSNWKENLTNTENLILFHYTMHIRLLGCLPYPNKDD